MWKIHTEIEIFIINLPQTGTVICITRRYRLFIGLLFKIWRENIIYLQISLQFLNFENRYIIPAPIDRMLITIEPNTSDPNLFTPFSLHLVENRPTLVRCIAFGGYPPPAIDVYIGSRNLSSMFLLKHEHQLMGGIRGLRSVIYRTERWTTELIPVLEYNEDLLKCIASVENMKPTVDRTRLNIDCESFHRFKKTSLCTNLLHRLQVPGGAEYFPTRFHKSSHLDT